MLDRRGTEPEIIAKAREAGVDLQNPGHPLLAHSYQNGRLFYVFYKTVAGAVGPQEYVLQRIRKEERFYATPSDRRPQRVVTFLVEVFKLRDGALKRADEHYGSYSLNRHYKRETVKDYEIGFGQINRVATGAAWPFEKTVLYKLLPNPRQRRGERSGGGWAKRGWWKSLACGSSRVRF
jgi:hypothetical protein